MLVDKANPRRVVFHFEATRSLLLCVDKYSAYEAKTEPHSFFNAQKDIKQMIYGV
jgi:hypothetical protein